MLKKKIIAIIPARYGSKRIKNKNLLIIKNNKTLLDLTYLQAIKSKYIDKILLTTESKKIINYCKSIGFKNIILRPRYLSTDKARSEDVILHALSNIKEKYDYFILLQPTSPLRSPSDIDNSLRVFLRNNYDALISISKSRNSRFAVKIKKKLIICKQDSNKKLATYSCINGAIYIAKINYFKQNKSFYGPNLGYFSMPRTRSLDIDTREDLKKLYKLLK
jgi:CMP-N-acetylneuraminic acid synthetase